MTAVLLFPPIPVDSYLLPCDLYTFYCNSLRIPRSLFRLRSIATAVYNDACYINAIDKTLVNAASFLPSIWRHVCVVLNHIPTVINNVVIAQFVGDTYLMHSFISILLTYLNASCSLVFCICVAGGDWISSAAVRDVLLSRVCQRRWNLVECYKYAHCPRAGSVGAKRDDVDHVWSELWLLLTAVIYNNFSMQYDIATITRPLSP